MSSPIQYKNMNKKSKKNKKKRAVISVKKVNKVRGRGGYFTDAVNFGKKVYDTLNEEQRPEASGFNKAVNTLGNVIGSKVGLGKQLGNAASWLSRVFGFGKYTVKRNSLATGWGQNVTEGGNVGAPPSFAKAKQGSDLIIAHQECVGDVYSSVTFTKKRYAINAGNPELFPWFHNIAALYEEYEILGMLYWFESSLGSGTNQAVPSIGTVTFATDYDVYDDNYSSTISMLSAEFASSAKADTSFYHAVECDPKRNVLPTLYVQTGQTSSTVAQGDARFSYMANTTVATEGQASNGFTIGKLWVTYHVRLSRPMFEIQTTSFSQHFRGIRNTGSGLQTLSNIYVGGNTFNITLSGSDRLRVSNQNRNKGYYVFTMIIKDPDHAGVWPAVPFQYTINNGDFDEVLATGEDGFENFYAAGVPTDGVRHYNENERYVMTTMFRIGGLDYGYTEIPIPTITGDNMYVDLLISSVRPEIIPTLTSTEKRLKHLEKMLSKLGTSKNEVQPITTVNQEQRDLTLEECQIRIDVIKENYTNYSSDEKVKMREELLKLFEYKKKFDDSSSSSSVSNKSSSSPNPTSTTSIAIGNIPPVPNYSPSPLRSPNPTNNSLIKNNNKQSPVNQVDTTIDEFT